jgi:hypothetical protein
MQMAVACTVVYTAGCCLHDIVAEEEDLAFAETHAVAAIVVVVVHIFDSVE